VKLWLEDNLGSRKALIQRALLFSGVTLFVLFLFQPFGTNNDISSYKYLRLSGYGLVTFCALLLSGAIEIGFARRRWSNTLRRMIIPSLYIVILAVFNHSYMVVAFLGSWHWQNQLLFVFYTLAIGLFPITFMVLVNRHSASIIAPQQVHIPETQTDSSNVTAISHTVQTKLITLTGDNKDDKIQVSLSQILFIKSADNYCELAILKDNIYSRQLLRCSLTSLLKQLPSNSQVFRCHRSYVVNLMLVESFTGNAGGLQLSMKSLDVMVPVSRSYVDTIKQALQLVPIAC
jgi:DNA-binding LytR/AlgR family response regulator